MRDAVKAAHLETGMDLLEAVSTPKKHVLEVLEDEKRLNLGFEESFFDKN